MNFNSGLFLAFAAFVASAAAQQGDLYCGDSNCYEVLGLVRGDDFSKADVGKAYRKLAAKFHPDKHFDPEAKANAEKRFMQIAAAYEVLRDDEARSEYDYMLDHPEEMWQNYYRYYRRRMAPKIDVRIVIAVTITLISAVQYYSAWTNYEEAIKYFASVPKYRIQATEIAKEDGLFTKALAEANKESGNKKANKKLSKELEETVLRQVIEEKMDIRGGYAKPKWTDVLWVQLFFLPWTSAKWAYFYGRWFWKFGIKREEYGEEEKLYVIRKNLGLSSGQFDAIPENEVEDMMEQELWIKENFVEWKQAKDDEMRAKMAQSGRYKQYRRYMKAHANDRMTFDDS